LQTIVQHTFVESCCGTKYNQKIFLIIGYEYKKSAMARQFPDSFDSNENGSAIIILSKRNTNNTGGIVK
jgi:hypothetical protein